jgi:UDP-glucose:(heptosyl)LPS alpha-1,3-glucosyltransferase
VRQRYNPFGGAERFVERALEALVAEGTQITLITRSWEGASRAGFAQIICDPPSGWWAGRTGRDRAFSRCVQATIAKGAFDLVQSHERIPGCSIFRAGDGVHAAWLARRAPALSPLQRFAQRISAYHRYVLTAEQAMFAHPALRAVICNSQMVAAEIEQYYGVDRGKLHVIYNGVDTDDFHPRLAGIHRQSTRQSLGIAQTVPVLLYVGSGYARKGVPQLLQAFSTMNERDAHLIIIGADRKLQAAKAVAAQSGVAGRTHFLGAVQDVRPFYAAADGFVLPTIYDPCPNAALEAMACGLPIVTSCGCGAKEWVQEAVNGWVVDIARSGALQAALQKLCDAAGNAAMRAHARSAVAHLDLQNMTEQLLKMYQTLCPEPQQHTLPE